MIVADDEIAELAEGLPFLSHRWGDLEKQIQILLPKDLNDDRSVIVRSEAEQEEMRQLSSPPTSSVCTPGLLNVKDGKLK